MPLHFGDIVNTAARMQSRSDPGRLHVAEAAAEILRNYRMFTFTDRGEMAVKAGAYTRPPFSST